MGCQDEWLCQDPACRCLLIPIPSGWEAPVDAGGDAAGQQRAIGVVAVERDDLATTRHQLPGTAELIVDVVADRAIAGDLLQRQPVWPVDLVGGPVLDEQRQALGGVPGLLGRRAVDGLALPQPVPVVGVGGGGAAVCVAGQAVELVVAGGGGGAGDAVRGTGPVPVGVVPVAGAVGGGAIQGGDQALELVGVAGVPADGTLKKGPRGYNTNLDIAHYRALKNHWLRVGCSTSKHNQIVYAVNTYAWHNRTS
jgi:hypothetical protein